LASSWGPKMFDKWLFSGHLCTDKYVCAFHPVLTQSLGNRCSIFDVCSVKRFGILAFLQPSVVCNLFKRALPFEGPISMFSNVPDPTPRQG